MGAQPVCPKPAPEVVAALCARFGDEARLAVLKMLAAKAESNVDIESPKPAQSASAVPSSPVVEGKDAAPKSPAAAVTTPTSMSPLPPGPSAPPQPTGPVADPAFTDSEIKTLSEPVPFAAWGPLHERALAYMRWRRDSAVASDASLAPSPEAAADMRLWRFVVAKNFDCPGAAEMYIGMLRWRRDAGMDKFRGEVLEANSGFFIDGAALLQTVLPCERDRKVMAAQPRMFTLEVEGGHQLLRDRSGNVVYIECPGTLDYPAILAIGDADYVRAVALARHASASPRPHTPWPLAPQLLRCPQPHTAAPNPTTAPLSPHHPPVRVPPPYLLHRSPQPCPHGVRTAGCRRMLQPGAADACARRAFPPHRTAGPHAPRDGHERHQHGTTPRPPPHLRVTAASAFRGSAASARAPPPLFVRAPRLRAVRRAAPRIRALCV